MMKKIGEIYAKMMKKHEKGEGKKHEMKEKAKKAGYKGKK